MSWNAPLTCLPLPPPSWVTSLLPFLVQQPGHQPDLRVCPELLEWHTPCPHPAPCPFGGLPAPCWLLSIPRGPVTPSSLTSGLWSTLSTWGWLLAPLTSDLGRGRPCCPHSPGTGSFVGQQRRSPWPPLSLCWGRRGPRGRAVCVWRGTCRPHRRASACPLSLPSRGPGVWPLLACSLLTFTPIDCTASWSLSQSQLPAPCSLLQTRV